MRSKVIVFDLDDTLYYEIDYLKSAFKEISEMFCYNHSSSDIYEKMLDIYSNKGDAFRFAVDNIKEHIDKDEFLIIGAGGIMNSYDAQKMIRAGADVVQIYSAFIFEGPKVVKKISRALTTMSE